MTRALVLHRQDSFVLDELYLPQLSKHPRYAVLRFLLILCVCHFSLRIIGASVHFLHGNFVLFQHFPAGEPIERNFLNNFSKIFSDFVWTATGDSFTQKIKLASGEE